MHVLLAIDGSSSADRARDLTATLAWPDGTTILIVTALDARNEFGVPLVVPSGHDLYEMHAAVTREAEMNLDAAERVVERPGLTIDRRILHGRAATTVVEEARACGADLIVMGNRGHSTLASIVLGSTSEEVVDHAPCPVLIARDDRVDEIVFAIDDSPGARLAEVVVAGWPLFRQLPVSVLTVPETLESVDAGLTAAFYSVAMKPYPSDLEQVRTVARELVEGAITRLQREGIAAVGEIAEGDPAAEIVTFARGRAHPIIVMGSRGQTGITRLVLGSVARNVLHHAHGSVLIVRQNVKVRPDENGSGKPVALTT
jgi:nucleotide-binding universal stress UspA family protein